MKRYILNIINGEEKEIVVNYVQVITLCFLIGMVSLILGSQLGGHFAKIINVNLSWISGVLLIVLAFMRTF